jgi:hypothetical protein
LVWGIFVRVFIVCLIGFVFDCFVDGIVLLFVWKRWVERGIFYGILWRFRRFFMVFLAFGILLCFIVVMERRMERCNFILITFYLFVFIIYRMWLVVVIWVVGKANEWG